VKYCLQVWGLLFSSDCTPFIKYIILVLPIFFWNCNRILWLGRGLFALLFCYLLRQISVLIRTTFLACQRRLSRVPSSRRPSAVISLLSSASHGRNHFECSNDNMSTREIVLDGGSPWGFRMHGGADVGQPLRISRVSTLSVCNAVLSGEEIPLAFMPQYMTHSSPYFHRMIKKYLCTWRLQYRMLQVMFKVSPASLQTFIDTRLTLTPSVINNSNYVIMISDWNCLKYFCLFFVL
jgi:hypothetical protein